MRNIHASIYGYDTIVSSVSEVTYSCLVVATRFTRMYNVYYVIIIFALTQEDFKYFFMYNLFLTA